MNTETAEIMHILQEECAEVIQSISKIFRFGFKSKWESQTNQNHLEEELGDLMAMVTLLIARGIVSEDELEIAAKNKLIKLSKWSNINLTNDK